MSRGGGSGRGARQQPARERILDAMRSQPLSVGTSHVWNHRLALDLGGATRRRRAARAHAGHHGPPRTRRRGAVGGPGARGGPRASAGSRSSISRATANQPMTNEDGTVQVVFNGEIYNHLALRRELLEKGHRFKTDHSDTEVIVHGYEEWGEASSSASPGCSRSGSGTPGGGGSSSRATGSASSRSTSPGPRAPSCSPRRSRRCSRTRTSRPTSSRAPSTTTCRS